MKRSEYWRHWDLILSFTLRDIKARYKQTGLGVAWAIVQPLSMMVVFTLVFSVFAKVPSDGLPYPIFAYSGLIFWTFFANSLTGGTLAMVANSPLDPEDLLSARDPARLGAPGVDLRSRDRPAPLRGDARLLQGGADHHRAVGVPAAGATDAPYLGMTGSRPRPT